MTSSFIPPILGNLSAPRAEPFYFGAPGNECLAWLHRPPAGRARGLGVVLCNPVGYDMMLAHRAYRYLATRLAAEGITVLRFEYPSTGDSVGWVDDPGRVAAWLDSIGGACKALRQQGGVERLVLFGLRSGGTLAAAATAAANIPDVAGFAAWAPYASGGVLLREMRALGRLTAHAAPGEIDHLARADGGLHVAGFGFSAQTVKDLEGLVLTRQATAPAPRCLLLKRDDLPADTRLEKHWTALGSVVESVVVPSYLSMMRDAFESQLPLVAVETLVNWVGTIDGDNPLRAESGHKPAPTQVVLDGRAPSAQDVREQPVSFGPDGRFTGVLTTPLVATQHTTAVLFPTVGANHRIGVNRLHVELARELAAEGYASLRMDIDGAGESGTVSERERFWEYKSDTYLDVAEGVRWLTVQPGIAKCVIWGICSGAYMAYHTAQADARVTGIVLFNLQFFRWSDNDVAENLERREAKSLGFYRKSALKPETWKRLLAGEVRVRTIYRGLRARVRKRVRGRLSLWQSQWSTRGRAPLREVTELSARGCRVSFVCTAEDIGLHEIKTHLGNQAVHATRLPGVEYVEVGVDAAADHVFTSLASQAWVKAWTLATMRDHFP